jgi:ParB-like chromosome segregation protein Spo0J
MADYAAVSKPLSWFRANPENYRSHPQEQQAVLQESLRRFGVFRNVVARPDGTILAGHGILAAAQAEGLTEFPCVIFDGSDAEARALMVADNE